jgi:hypothetical protein
MEDQLHQYWTKVQKSQLVTPEISLILFYEKMIADNMPYTYLDKVPVPLAEYQWSVLPMIQGLSVTTGTK